MSAGAWIERLFAIGNHGDGTNRLAFAGENEAFDLAEGWMRDAGLAVERDPAGNLVGRLRGRRPELPEVWTGSHLDTPYNGGAYDGAVGSLCGLEAVARIAASGPLERTVAVIVWRVEESSRFQRGYYGSRGLCGLLEPGWPELTDHDGVTVREAIEAIGLGEPPAEGWLDRGPGILLEAHMEQGPRLAELGAPLAVVTGIAAMAGFSVDFHGNQGHGGTTPMEQRADALAAAAEFFLAVRAAATAIEDGRATSGTMRLEPDSPNTIPSRATIYCDVRAPDDEGLAVLLDAVRTEAAAAAARNRCTVDVVERWSYAAQTMADEVQAALRGALEEQGLPTVELFSGAGHDAAVLAEAGVPAGMLFVRSLNGGVSHHPDEYALPEDVERCTRTLELALRRLGAACGADPQRGRAPPGRASEPTGRDDGITDPRS
jgi:hydantoinase/carbamoylase family amidase